MVTTLENNAIASRAASALGEWSLGGKKGALAKRNEVVRSN
ncbi:MULTISPECIES: hypothetical protein [Cyanophyceae]|nr:hypothetical protein [Trichocoleus sp. FACHB-69]